MRQSEFRQGLAIATLLYAAGAAAAAAARTTPMPFADARPVLAAFANRLPPGLRDGNPAARARTWPAWVARQNLAIRERVDRGNEDSIVNLLLFGTSFTAEPRALNDSAKLGGRDRAAAIVRARIDDLVKGIAAPGGNDRLQFARAEVERHGIDPASPGGHDQVRGYLLGLMRRVVGEVDGYVRSLDAAKSQADPAAEFRARSTLFRDRGLSSDTSFRPDFAIAQTLAAVSARGLFASRAVRRVAVVGPGLDFTDKAEGFDFYPEQTTQPFAVMDALVRLGLARLDRLTMSTFDVSPRVNAHLAAARRRAAAGTPYTLTLALADDVAWRPDVIAFWSRFGGAIGEAAPDHPPVPPDVRAKVRSVRIRPEAALAIEPHDLNIVLERLDPLVTPGGDARFDLIVATNVFVYYEPFEQALALANVAAMLRPGALLLSNNVLPETADVPLHAIGSTDVVYSSRQDDTDRIIWYQRR